MKQKDIETIIDKVLHVKTQDIEDVKVLKKGMTNRSFIFQCKGKRYIMRIPGEGTEQLINRRQEANVYQALEGYYPAELLQPATPESFGTEFLDYKMAVKTVKSFEDALGHIQENSSRHSECIVTENKERATLFTKIVDAACVYTNVSTAFTDGAQFGLGAEIGISTQKLHARGPMGLEEITSYKWVIEGDGQTRW